MLQNLWLLCTVFGCVRLGMSYPEWIGSRLTFLPEVWQGRGGLLLCVLAYAFLLLTLGGIVPRCAVARRYEKTASEAGRVLRVLGILFWPFNMLVKGTSTLLLKLIGVDPHAETEEVTEQEIRMLVDIGEEAGAIESAEREMIENIFEFNNQSAEDIMIHRTDVTSLWVEDPPETVLETIRTTGLSRFPVYDRNTDDIIGILNTRDYLLELREKQPRPLRALLREAYFVPETVQADALFRDMQKRKNHIAIVVDEYGGLSGIVTMEDLLEEIVGNIYDETDPAAET